MAVVAGVVMALRLRKLRAQAETLARNEALFRSLVENANEIIAVLDGSGRFTYVNPSIERVLGYPPSELWGRVSLELVADADKAAIDKTFAAALAHPGSTQLTVCTMLDKGGAPVAVEARGSTLAIGGELRAVLSIRDVSAERRAYEDQKRLQRQLAHAQKLETFGTLAGGIAHDFNNLLTPILGGAELAKGTLAPSHPARGLFERIEESARKARALVQRMMLLSKTSTEERRPIDLALLVREAADELRRTLPAGVEIDFKPPAEPLTVLADDAQLEHALRNLTTNAAQAMQQAGGKLTILLEVLRTNDPARKAHPLLREGAFVHLCVQDTGAGMNTETARRAFEPYFSTQAAREAGGGAGLGLSLAHSIVSAHGGVIELVSSPGSGTRVDVYLPLARDPSVAPEPEQPVERDGKASILLVDDEPSVASVCRELLKMLGFEVEVCSDPREALERYSAEPERFDLVITDHSMPHMTGVQLAEALRALSGKRVPIVLTTGFAQEDVLGHGGRAVITEVVPKPYAIEELESAIERALASRTGG